VSRHVTLMTIDDAEHYTAAERAAIVAGYLPHEREARAKGIPVLGSGRVFPVEEEKIIIPPMPVQATGCRSTAWILGTTIPSRP
jgi:hypothetical protein